MAVVKQQRRVTEHILHSRRSPVGSIRDDVGATCVAFFFRAFVSLNQDPLTSTGLFDHLTELYKHASPSSPIASAVVVLAGTSASSCFQHGSTTAWHYEMHMRAVTSVRGAIADPVARTKDETLMAVLLLDYAENIKAVHCSTSTTHIHYGGAIALLRNRKRNSNQTELSQSLLRATKHNSFWQSLQNSSNNETVSNVQSMSVSTPSDTLMALDAIILQTFRVESLFSRGLVSRHAASSTTQKLMVTLACWESLIPHHWRPQQMPSIAISSRMRGLKYEHYVSMDVAFIYNQWRCVRLMLLLLEQRIAVEETLSQATGNDRLREPILEVAHLIDGIYNSVPYFFGAPHLDGICCSIDGVFSVPPHMNYGLSDRCSERFAGEHLGRWHLVNILKWLSRIVQSNASWSQLSKKSVIVALEKQYASLKGHVL
ncbi:hypothetical protein LTR97_002166 [Elasticomyces elasticus]|uniref:Transcription factor domain-containing protein n=1 Tax=Elasticomyces elasticus TaxID=574655 RepID=A0AAN7WHB2_9PEZI|nr:hypothetical protein LTR97_002166 [Elasticomyces elasticus]